MRDARFQPGKVLTAKRPTSTSSRSADASASLAQEPVPTCLINQQWELCSEEVLKVLTDNTDYLVVGVLGTHGSGKSTFMNAMCGLGPPSQPGQPAQSTGSSQLPPFPTASMEHVLQGHHCTSAVEIRVNPHERVIGLDTPPIFSPSVLLDLMALDRPPPGLSGTTGLRQGGRWRLPFEGVQQLMALQMACLLLSVCHVVVVMADDLCCPHLHQFLQLAEICTRQLPDPFQAAGAASSTATVQVADTVFVLSGIQPEDMDGSYLHLPHTILAAALETTAFVTREEARITPGHLLHLSPKPSNSSTPPKPGLNFFPLPQASMPPSLLLHGPLSLPSPLASTPAPTPHAAGPASKTDTRQSRPQAASMPARPAHRSGGSALLGSGSVIGSVTSGPTSGISAGSALDGPAVQRLRNLILGLPRKSFGGRVVSERAWLKGCEKVWESIKRSPDIADVYGHQVNGVCQGAAGWTVGR